MPILMDHTVNGVNHPNSWWTLSSLNLNMTNRTASIVEFGYHDKDSRDADPNTKIDIQIFSCTTPEVFDFYFGQIERVVNAAYITTIELWLVLGDPDLPEPTDGFFSAGTVFSPVGFSSAEVGDVANNVVAVTFTDNVMSGVSLSTGITIKINGISATISSAAQPVDTRIIQFTLSAPVGLTDLVTVEFDNFGASLTDGNAIGVASFSAQDVTNQVGEHWRFNDASNSGQFAIHF